MKSNAFDLPPLSRSAGLSASILSSSLKCSSPSLFSFQSRNATLNSSTPFFPSSPIASASLLKRKLEDRLTLAALVPPTQISVRLRHLNISIQEVTLLQLLTIMLSVQQSMSTDSGTKSTSSTKAKGMSFLYFFFGLFFFFYFT
jgi:hypothetical protein